MITFKQYYLQESRLGGMVGAGMLAANSLLGGFVKDWSKYYQTSNDPDKEKRATSVISREYNVPSNALKAINVAADIFAGDEGKTKAQLVEYLKHTGAVESGYRTRLQHDGGPARGYWQVEPTTAIDLIKNSSPLFGAKFHKYFGDQALDTLQTWDKHTWSKFLEKHDDLGATMAAAKWIASGWND